MRLVIASLAIVAGGVAWWAQRPTPLESPQPSRPAAAVATSARGAAIAPLRPAAAAEDGFRFQAALEYQFRDGEGYHDAEAVAIADIDGDGREDLLGISAFNRILVWKQRPDGALADLNVIGFGDGAYLTRSEVAVADFNSDGVADVATSGVKKEVWGGSNQNVVNVLLSNRAGAPAQRQVALDGIARLSQWQVLDVNRDGRWDIVGSAEHAFPAGTQCGLDGTLNPTFCPAIGVAYGDGQGGFTKYEAFLIGTPHGIIETEVGDVDGDGMVDLIGLAPRPRVYDVTPEQDVWVFRQRRNGGFEPRTTLYTLFGVSTTVSITAGQLDSDSDHRVDTASLSQSSILRVHPQAAPGQALGAYDPFTPYDRRATQPDTFLAQDIDGDRRADVIASQFQWVGSYGIPQVAVYLQRNGTLQDPIYINAPSARLSLNHRALAVGDLNGDGCRDLAIAATNDRLALLYGTGCVQHRPIAARRVGIAGRIPRVHVWERIPPGDRAAARRP